MKEKINTSFNFGGSNHLILKKLAKGEILINEAVCNIQNPINKQ